MPSETPFLLSSITSQSHFYYYFVFYDLFSELILHFIFQMKLIWKCWLTPKFWLCFYCDIISLFKNYLFFYFGIRNPEFFSSRVMLDGSDFVNIIFISFFTFFFLKHLFFGKLMRFLSLPNHLISLSWMSIFAGYHIFKLNQIPKIVTDFLRLPFFFFMTELVYSRTSHHRTWRKKIQRKIYHKGCYNE